MWQAGIKGSTFAKASFNSSTNREDIDIDDPNFWSKWAKKANIDTDMSRVDKELILLEPRNRKKRSVFTRLSVHCMPTSVRYTPFHVELSYKRAIFYIFLGLKKAYINLREVMTAREKKAMRAARVGKGAIARVIVRSVKKMMNIVLTSWLSTKANTSK